MTMPARWIIWLLIATALFLLLYAVKSILLPFVIGILVAYFLDPAADKLEAWKCSRTLATVIIVAIFFTITIGGLALLVPLLSDEVTRFIKALPSYIRQAQTELLPLISDYADRLGVDTSHAQDNPLSKELLGVVSNFTSGILQSGFAVLNLLSLLLITPVVAFYLLRDWDRITARIDDLLPRDYAETIREQAQKVDETLAGFLRGQVNVCLILAVYNAVALSIVGLNYAVLIGLVSGFLIIIPYLGTVFTGLLALGIAYLQFDTHEPIIAVAVIFVIGQVAEGNFLTPKLVGDRVGLHPVWVIFGMLAGAALFGFVGIFLAVPVTAMIGVLVRFAIVQYRQSRLYDSKSRKG